MIELSKTFNALFQCRSKKIEIIAKNRCADPECSIMTNFRGSWGKLKKFERVCVEF